MLSVRKKDSLTFEDAATRFCIGIANLIRWSKDIEPKAYPLRMYKVNLEDLAADVKRPLFQQNIEMHKANGRPIVDLDESGFAHDRPP